MTAALPLQRENGSIAMSFKEEVSSARGMTTPFMGFYFLICSLHGGAQSKKKKSKFGGASATLRPLQSSKQPNIQTVSMGTPQSIEYQ